MTPSWTSSSARTAVLRTLARTVVPRTLARTVQLTTGVSWFRTPFWTSSSARTGVVSRTLARNVVVPKWTIGRTVPGTMTRTVVPKWTIGRTVPWTVPWTVAWTVPWTIGRTGCFELKQTSLGIDASWSGTNGPLTS
jgi:hypothetical protein